MNLITTKTATDTLPLATYPCAIRARDFSQDTLDPNRDLWNCGTLRHVITALDGALVAITVDNQTGHSLCGVRLVGLNDHGDRLIIEERYGDAPGDVCRPHYLLFLLGSTIMPLTHTGGTAAKFIATGSYAAEVAGAIRVAQAVHGDAEGRSWGKWTANVTRDGVFVRYAPQRGNAANADRWGTTWCGDVRDGRVISSFPGRVTRAQRT